MLPVESPSVSRRSFLAGLLGAVASTQMPLPAIVTKGSIPALPATYEYGEAVSFPLTLKGGGEHEMVIEFLRSRAEVRLPPGTKYEIMASVPLDFGRTKSMGWYATNDMKQPEGITFDGKLRFDTRRGIYTTGLYTV